MYEGERILGKKRAPTEREEDTLRKRDLWVEACGWDGDGIREGLAAGSGRGGRDRVADSAAAVVVAHARTGGSGAHACVHDRAATGANQAIDVAGARADRREIAAVAILVAEAKVISAVSVGGASATEVGGAAEAVALAVVAAALFISRASRGAEISRRVVQVNRGRAAAKAGVGAGVRVDHGVLALSAVGVGVHHAPIGATSGGEGKANRQVQATHWFSPFSILELSVLDWVNAPNLLLHSQ